MPSRHIRFTDHVAVIEAVFRGENASGWPDKTVILTHVREMQRMNNQLREELELARTQLGILTKEKS